MASSFVDTVITVLLYLDIWESSSFHLFVYRGHLWRCLYPELSRRGAEKSGGRASSLQNRGLPGCPWTAPVVCRATDQECCRKWLRSIRDWNWKLSLRNWPALSNVGVPCASHTRTFANVGKEASTRKPTLGTDSNMGLSWCLCYTDITDLASKGNVAVVQVFHCCYQDKWGKL